MSVETKPDTNKPKKLVISGRQLTLPIILVAVLLIFGIGNPGVFFSPLNIESIGFALPEIALMALVIAVAMLAAGIDLSVVAVANLGAISTSLISTTLQEQGQSLQIATAIAVISALLIAALCGALNAAVIAYLKVAPIIATLATQMVFAGLAIGITKGKAQYSGAELLGQFGSSSFGFIPYILIVAVLIFALVAFVVKKTRWGLQMKLFGTSRRSFFYAGESSTFTTFVVYIMSAMIAGSAGVIQFARTSSASAEYGTSYLMLAITIAVLAGVNPFGGRPIVWMVLFAALTLQMLSNGLNSLGVSPYIYQILQGLILVFTLSMNKQVIDKFKSLFKSKKVTDV